MSEKKQKLKTLVNERLTAAAEEIFALFERTLVEYEEEMCLSKEENKRKQQLLDSVLKPQVVVHRADVQVQSERQGQEESEQLRIKQEEEQLQDVTEVIVKSEYEEQTENDEDSELPASSSTQPMETDATDGGGSQNSETSAEKATSTEQMETKADDDGSQNSETSAEKTSNVINDDVSGPNLHECSVCQRKLGRKQDLRRHMLLHTGEKPFSCPVCEKKFRQKSNLKAHVVIHSDAVETFLQQHQTQTDESREEPPEGEDCGGGEAETDVSVHSDTEEQTNKDKHRVQTRAASSAQQTETKANRDDKKDSAQNSSPSPKRTRTRADNSSMEDVQIHQDSRDKGSSRLELEDIESVQILSIKEEEEPLQEFTAVSVKSEDECSLFQQIQTEENTDETDNEDWTQGWEPLAGSSTQQMETEAEGEISAELSSSLKSNVATDAGGKTKHECPICKKKLGRKQELKRHMLLHTGEKPFSCPVCEKRFIQKSNLKSHIVTHLDSVEEFILNQKQTEENREDCGGAETDVSFEPHEIENNFSDTDNEEEPRAGSSAQHMETEAERDDYNVNPGQHTHASLFFKTAETCDDKSQGSMDDIDLFINNAITVNSIAEYQCSLCTKTFGRMENLKRHILIHTGEKAFSCPVCNKRFTLKQHLKLHMVVHTGEKLFSCSVCNKTFNRKDNLRSHMKIHSQDRPFGCSECGARFNLNKNLLRHMTVHTGETPFSCSVCNSSFSSQLCLKRHMKIHTEDMILTQTGPE